MYVRTQLPYLIKEKVSGPLGISLLRLDPKSKFATTLIKVAFSPSTINGSLFELSLKICLNWDLEECDRQKNPTTLFHKWYQIGLHEFPLSFGKIGSISNLRNLSGL